MRSIRRSLLGYLLVLLALAFGAVGLFVDRFAIAAIRAREEAESKRIEQTFDVRRHEAAERFDAELLSESKALVKLVPRTVGEVLNIKVDDFGRPRGGPGGPPRPAGDPVPPLKASDDEARAYRACTAIARLVAPPGVMATVCQVALFEPRPTPPARRDVIHVPYPGWVEYDAPRAVGRIQDELRKILDQDENGGRVQLTLAVYYSNRAATRTIVPVASGRISQPLPLHASWLEPGQDNEPRFDDIDVPGKGNCRRVVIGSAFSGRPIFFTVALPSPPPHVLPAPPNYRPNLPFHGSDFALRVFYQNFRPYSELSDRLDVERQERDEQLARVRVETKHELAELRFRLGLISVGSFVALALGGLFIVARGLYPIRKLSDAVSRVSEKDFRLPVEKLELSHELAPIHARLTQTLDLLRRAFAREKEAVADISHELRTPIASLLATIDIALRKPRTPEQYRIALDECRVITRQLGQLVERIMTLANLDAGNARTTSTRTDAAIIADGCAAVMRPIASSVGVSLFVDAESPLDLDTDPDKLREVLVNLLHNAVEYNKPGGTVELTGKRDAGRIVLAVRDTGIGMTPEVRERIFERFFRADPSRTATGVHAGLGLAIVKEFVERLNGRIDVESEPGVGTTFRVSFPAAADAPDAPVVGGGPRQAAVGASS